MTTAFPALAWTEARLLSRDWSAMLFAFVFPPLLMLVLAGVFAEDGGAVYGGASGSDYYIAAYIGIPLGAVALVGLPVMLASYRERGVLRRMEAFGVSAGSVVAAQTLVTAGIVVLGAVLVLATAAPTYGVPAVDDPFGVLAGFVAGMVTMLLIGVALGLAAPTARAAQALGLLAFLPMWLLGGGGPPRAVMTDVMADVSDVLPLWHTTAAIRDPWIGAGDALDHVAALALWFVVAAAAVVALRRRGA